MPSVALQPRQFLAVENQIVAVGLHVVVGIVAQRIADDAQPVVRDQRLRGRMRAMLQIIGCEHFREVLGEWLAAQDALDALERVADARRMIGIDDDAGPRIQIAGEEHVHQSDAKAQRDGRGEIGVVFKTAAAAPSRKARHRCSTRSEAR